MNFYNKMIYILIYLFFILAQWGFCTIVTDKSEYVFQEVKQGDIVSGDFKIKNNGNEKAHLIFHPSCDCLLLATEEIVLNPHEEHILFWDFLTQEYNGHAIAEIIVSIEGQENLFLTISGFVGDANPAQKDKAFNICIPIFICILLALIFFIIFKFYCIKNSTTKR